MLNEVKKLPGFLCHSERSEESAQTIVLYFKRSFASLRMTGKNDVILSEAKKLPGFLCHSERSEETAWLSLSF